MLPPWRQILAPLHCSLVVWPRAACLVSPNLVTSFANNYPPHRISWSWLSTLLIPAEHFPWDHWAAHHSPLCSPWDHIMHRSGQLIALVLLSLLWQACSSWRTESLSALFPKVLVEFLVNGARDPFTPNTSSAGFFYASVFVHTTLKLLGSELMSVDR